MRKIRFGREKFLLSPPLYRGTPSPAFIDGNFKSRPGCTAFKILPGLFVKGERVYAYELFATQPGIVNFKLHKQGAKEILTYQSVGKI